MLKDGSRMSYTLNHTAGVTTSQEVANTGYKRRWRREFMPLEFIKLTGADGVDPYQDELIAVYRAVYSLAPYNEGEDSVASFAERLPRHAQQEGFRYCLALENGRVVGFSYGTSLEPELWWWKQVAPALTEADKATWLDGAFSFVELAVRPDKRKRGIGGRLHDDLLRGIPYRTALLSTDPEARPALSLYRKRGWIVLLDSFYFPGSAQPSYIMGLELR
jgi:ribosomal protein S18 acetylase RimI-like enzyme